MSDDDAFVRDSAAVRRRLRPTIEAVCAQHARPIEVQDLEARVASVLNAVRDGGLDVHDPRHATLRTSLGEIVLES